MLTQINLIQFNFVNIEVITKPLDRYTDIDINLYLSLMSKPEASKVIE